MRKLVRSIVAEDGVTVLEIVIVLIILAILVGVVITTSIVATGKIKSGRCKANQEIINDALNKYYLVEECYPDDVRELQKKGYIKKDFEWKCPGDSEILYYEHYDSTRGRVICPKHPMDDGKD